MTRRRHSFRTRLTRESEQLTKLATGLSQSGSRIEDAFWESRLSALIGRLLEAGSEQAIISAMDHLYRSNPRAYDELADMTESCSEAGRVRIGATEYDMLLVALPVLAWSRYAIPSGHVPDAVLEAVAVQLAAHVLARDLRFVLADYFFSPDQMPPGYAETWDLAEGFRKALAAARPLAVDPGTLPETGNFISDIRYFVGAIAVTPGSPVFRWQEDENAREEALTQWTVQGLRAMQPLFPGCAFEVLTPAAFYAAWRDADRRARPFSVRAAVAFLATVLEEEASGLRAVVAPFYDDVGLSEYRVGFTRTDSAEVLHGVVWPLIGAEDEDADTSSEIETVLRESGIAEVTTLEDRMPLEFCEDCGAPLFPNPEGEAVHAGLSDHDGEAAEPALLH